MHVNNVQSHG